MAEAEITTLESTADKDGHDPWYDRAVRCRLEALLKLASILHEDLRRSVQQLIDGITALSQPMFYHLRQHLARHVCSLVVKKYIDRTSTSTKTLIEFYFQDEGYHSSKAELDARVPVEPGSTRHSYTHLAEIFPEFVSWLPEFVIHSAPSGLYLDYRAQDFMDGILKNVASARVVQYTTFPRVPLKIDRAILGENGKADCSICLQNIEGGEVAKLPCNHIFHDLCIFPWLSQQRAGLVNDEDLARAASCPLCRKTISKGIIHYLILDKGPS